MARVASTLTAALMIGLIAPPATSSSQSNDPEGPTLDAALQEQLGLRLEQRRQIPVEVMVIDRAHEPTKN